MNTRVAVIQLVSSSDVARNLPRIEALVREAAMYNPVAIFLPENFCALANPDARQTGEAEADPGGPVRRLMSSLALETQTWIFAGTMPLSVRPDGSGVPGERVRAASIVYDPEGKEVARYDKIHMFDVEVADAQKSYRESDTFEPGEDVVSLTTPLGRIGLTVCYDIRFPELYRRLFAEPVDVITVPSAFTTVTGAAHFEVLLRARAIENSAFVIAACQGGKHDSGRETWGHSMVIDPWGEILCEAGSGEAVLIADLDLDRQRQVRRDMPTFSQRRLL